MKKLIMSLCMLFITMTATINSQADVQLTVTNSLKKDYLINILDIGNLDVTIEKGWLNPSENTSVIIKEPSEKLENSRSNFIDIQVSYNNTIRYVCEYRPSQYYKVLVKSFDCTDKSGKIVKTRISNGDSNHPILFFYSE